MNLIFWIAYKLGLKQKFWGDMFIKYHQRKINNLVKKIDLNVKDIKFKKTINP